VGRIRRLPAAFGRLAAIALTVRSQRLAAIAVAPPADLVHAMAYMGIPVGLALGRRDGAPVVYDARDIYTEARNIARLPGPARRLFGWVERRWARGASRVMTVNRPYAEVMAQRFGTGLPVIVMNSWPASAVQSEPTRRLRDALGLGDEERIVLYHGGLFPDRGIEQLIAALGRLGPEVHLVLLGYGVLEPELRRQAMDPALGGRLHVLPAVPPAELLDWVASADIAAMPIQPSTLNHRLTTPNKLFEAMAAGVAVVASNLPGMAAIVEETGCGVTCDPADPKAIAGAIRAILELPDDARLAMRERALAAARGPYAWETQVDVLLAEYSRLTGRPW
jgi:glycosyltransferase involved in cell wall biosynthesis